MNEPTNILAANARPFQTSDALLAACLYFAGVPFLDPVHPCVHRYDARNLKAMGFDNLSLEDAANKAWAQRKRGTILYIFKRPNELPALLKAFHDEEHQIADSEGMASDRLATIMGLDNLMVEERLVRIACLLLKMRLQFMRLWETQTPWLRIMDAGEAEQCADGTVRYPGWKDIPLNASDELKKKMNL